VKDKTKPKRTKESSDHNELSATQINKVHRATLSNLFFLQLLHELKEHSKHVSIRWLFSA
jgi:hypothetical protein